MNKTNVKKYAKTAALVLLVCAIFALLFFGMWKLLGDDRGAIVAEYDGIRVYESDIKDLVNYLVVSQAQDQGQDVNYTNTLYQAAQTYVRYKILEIDLEEDGYVVDEAKVKESLEKAKAQLEESLGYKEWMEKYHVSKKFLEEDVRRAEIAKLYHELHPVTITEQEAKNYYTSYALSSFARPAGYYWNSVVLPVTDITDEAESAEAKTEMQGYLDKVLAGSMTLEDVDKALEKYDDNPYSVYEGEDVTKKENLKIYEDKAAFEAHLAEIDEEFKNRNKDAAEDSKEYEDYMNYLGKVFEANVYYALQNMEPGEVWNEVLVSFPGYFIIQLETIETENGFIPYEEVREQIFETMKTREENENLEEYLVEIETYYRAVYYLG